MRNPSVAFNAALLAAKDSGIVPRRFLYVRAKDRETGEPAEIGLWTGDDDVSVTVRDGQTGSLVVRTYYGMGTTLKIPEISMVSDLTIQTVACEISQIDAVTEQLVRGYDVRLAKCDIHEGLLSTETRQLVDNPEIAFLGECDGSDGETPAAGGEGKFTLEIVSDAIRMLTRTNPRKRSYEGQKRRSGDDFGLYSNAVAAWKVAWGEVAADGSGNASSSTKADSMRKVGGLIAW